eukprot:3147618-Rhodomonas_salina.1
MTTPTIRPRIATRPTGVAPVARASAPAQVRVACAPTESRVTVVQDHARRALRPASAVTVPTQTATSSCVKVLSAASQLDASAGLASESERPV